MRQKAKRVEIVCKAQIPEGLINYLKPSDIHLIHANSNTLVPKGYIRADCSLVIDIPIPEKIVGVTESMFEELANEYLKKNPGPILPYTDFLKKNIFGDES